MSVFDQANTKLDECFSEIDRLKKRIDSEGRYLDEWKILGRWWVLDIALRRFLS